jgi:hypothetical protein
MPSVSFVRFERRESGGQGRVPIQAGTNLTRWWRSTGACRFIATPSKKVFAISQLRAV